MAPQGQRDSLGAGEHISKPLRWPLVNKFQARSSATPLNKDARLYNCYAEYDGQDEEYIVYKRPGLSTVPFQSEAAALGLGIYNQTGLNFLYSTFANAITLIGTLYVQGNPLGVIDGTGGPYTFETVGPAGGLSNIVVLGNTVKSYYVSKTFSPTNPVFHLNAITDIDFPTNRVPGWVYLDGTLYTMDQAGNIFGAEGDQAAVWDPLNLIKANSNADLGVALAKQLNVVIALKRYSTQMFYDAGNPPPGSTLLPVPDAQLPLGCLHANSVQSIDNTLLWLTSNETASPQIVQMDNLVPKIVSTPPVERILDQVSWSNVVMGVRSWVIKHGGHRFYGITIPQLNITFVYDIDQQLWYVWTDVDGNYWPIVSMSFQDPAVGPPVAPGIHVAQHVSNGNIYQLDGDYVYPNDYGTLFPVDIYTPSTGFGTVRRKYLKGIYFRADQTPYSTLQVRYTQDDFQTWSNFRTVDLSKRRPRLMDCGSFTKRAYHYRHQKNTSFRIKSADLAMDVGTL